MPSHVLVVAIVALFLMLGCAQGVRPLNAAELEQTKAAARPNNRVAIQLYRQLGQKQGNVTRSQRSYGCECGQSML